MVTETLFLPGTEVELRGLRWEVINATPMGDQTLVRLRGTGGAFGGSEVDVLTPFEEVRPVVHQIDPTRPTHLANWLVFHQAFLLEQALGPNALLAVTRGRLGPQVPGGGRRGGSRRVPEGRRAVRPLTAEPHQVDHGKREPTGATAV